MSCPAQATTELRNSQELDYSKVLKQSPSWPTFSPMGSYALYAELAALSWLHSHGRWHLADRLWWTGLLPEGELVMEVGTGCYYMVLKVFDMAALVWPMLQLKPNAFTWGRPDQLTWKFATKQLDFKVLATQVVSPMAAWSAQEHESVEPQLEVLYHAVGEPQDLLRFQSSRVFCISRRRS